MNDWRAEVRRRELRGDKTSHPFHGNQHTSGAGGAAPSVKVGSSTYKHVGTSDGKDPNKAAPGTVTVKANAGGLSKGIVYHTNSDGKAKVVPASHPIAKAFAGAKEGQYKPDKPHADVTGTVAAKGAKKVKVKFK